MSALDYALNVTVQSSSFRRGIYLRHPSEVSKRETYKVTVDPIFPELASSDAKLNFELKLRLSCPDQWVTCPDYLILAKSGKTFSIEVDPRALPEGMHVSSVQGSLDDHPEAGFIFQVPITVLKPQIVSGFDAYGPRDDMDNSMSLGTLSLEQGERLRKFLVPPLGCTYIDAIISDSRHAPLEGAESTSAAPDEKETSVSGDASSRLLAVHAVQLMQGSSYSKHEKQVIQSDQFLFLNHSTFISGIPQFATWI